MFDKQHEIENLIGKIKHYTTLLERLMKHTDTNCLNANHVTSSQATGYHGTVCTVGKTWEGRD